MLPLIEEAGVGVRPARLAGAVAVCPVSVKLPSGLAVSALPFCDRLGSPVIFTVTVSVPSSVSSARLVIEMVTALVRSEERGVGKEGRSRGSPYHLKKKKEM